MNILSLVDGHKGGKHLCSATKGFVANLWYHDFWTIWTLDTSEWFISNSFQDTGM